MVSLFFDCLVEKRRRHKKEVLSSFENYRGKSSSQTEMRASLS